MNLKSMPLSNLAHARLPDALDMKLGGGKLRRENLGFTPSE